MHKLNQILAIERGTKSRINGEITKMHHTLQKPALLNGFSKTYQRKNEDSDSYPPERQRVQVVAADMLKRAGRLLAELADVTATKDYANCQARADLVVDGEVLVKDVPATFLLFLEKQLTDLKTFVAKIRRVGAEIDPASRSLEVEAVLDNADGRLRPGLFARVELDLPDRGTPPGGDR